MTSLPFAAAEIATGSAVLSLPRRLTLASLLGEPLVDPVQPGIALAWWLDDLLATDSGLNQDARDVLLLRLGGRVRVVGEVLGDALAPYEQDPKRGRPGKLVVCHLTILDHRYAQLGNSPLFDLQTGEAAPARSITLRTLAYDLTRLFTQRRAAMYQRAAGRKQQDRPRNSVRESPCQV